MYTKEELYDFQKRIDIRDAKERDIVAAQPFFNQSSNTPEPSFKIWDEDEGIIETRTESNEYPTYSPSSELSPFHGELQYFYALKPMKEDINIIVFSHKSPFDLEDMRIINWGGQWFKDKLLGWRREPEKIYKNFSKAAKIVSGTPTDFVSLTKSLKSEEDRDLNIYYEYNKGNISLDEVLDKFQIDIINGYKNESIHLSGPAGTGKSVVAGKIYDGIEQSKMAIIPNDGVKKDYAGKSTISYDVLSNKIASDVSDAINKMLDSNNIPDSMIGEQKFIINKKAIVKFKWFNNHGRQLLFSDNDFISKINELGKGEIELLKTINQKNINDLYEMDLKIENIYDAIEEIDNEYPFDDVDDISKMIIRDFFDVEKLPSFIVFDEAPILCDFPLVYGAVYYANRIGKKFILTYDIAQHEHKKIIRLKDITDIEDTYKLNIVFRTTREIFETAVEYLDDGIDFKAPISVESSVTHTSEPLYDKVIRFSDVIRDTNSIIGAEYDDLSVEIDVPVLKSNYHLYYILCTRAIKNLNFVKTRYR